ncbi:hypothetical protein Peur_031878 [Populus x canadensis]
MKTGETGLSEVMPPEKSELGLQAKQENSSVSLPKWTIPRKFLENYQLTRIAFECRRECGSCSDVVQSLCEPEEEWSEERHQDSNNVDNGHSLASVLFQDCNHSKSLKNIQPSSTDYRRKGE